MFAHQKAVSQHMLVDNKSIPTQHVSRERKKIKENVNVDRYHSKDNISGIKVDREKKRVELRKLLGKDGTLTRFHQSVIPEREKVIQLNKYKMLDDLIWIIYIGVCVLNTVYSVPSEC